MRSRSFAAQATRSSMTLLGRLAQPQPEGDVLGHAQVGVERVVLEDHGDVALLGREVVDDAAADRQRAVGDLLQPGDHAQRRRLAAARGPDEDEQLAVVRLEGEVLHGPDAVRVDLADLLELDLSHGLHLSSRSSSRLQAWNAGPSAANTSVAVVVRGRRAEERLRLVGAELCERKPHGLVLGAARQAEQALGRASRAGTRSRPRRRTRSGCRRAPAPRSIGAARSAGGTPRAAPGPSRPAGPTASSGGASSPQPPSRPISSPANTIGTPGVVICSPTPTRWRSRDPETVRKRAVSWLSSSVHECRTDRQGTPARNARMVATACRPSNRGAGAPEERVVVEAVSPQPPPGGSQEARVVHHSVPAAGAEIVPEVVPVLGDQQAVGASLVDGGAGDLSDLAIPIDVPVPARHVGDVDSPAVELERRDEPPANGVGHPGAQLRRAPVELGQGEHAAPRGVAAGNRGVEEVEGPLRFAAPPARRTNQSCSAPVWLRVRSPTTRMPRPWAAATSDESAVSPPRSGSMCSNDVASYRCTLRAGKTGVR